MTVPPKPHLPPPLATEVHERIIDFVAETDARFYISEWDSLWTDGAFVTLKACSLTCRAWRHRSQFHLMRTVGIQPTIDAGKKSFEAVDALFLATPGMKDALEVLTIDGKQLDIPRFHLVPIKARTFVGSRLCTLYIESGPVYLPTAFFVSMRQLSNVTSLHLCQLTFQSFNDVRRTIDSLQSLKRAVLTDLSWSPTKPEIHPHRASWRHSHIKLKNIRIQGGANWVLDPHTIQLLDWLAASGAVSDLHTLCLHDLMLLDDRVMKAVDGLIRCTRHSNCLQKMRLSLGPMAANVELLHSSLRATLLTLNDLEISCVSTEDSVRRIIDFISAILLRRPEATPGQLHPLFIGIVFHHYPPFPRPDLSSGSWESLDRMLSQRQDTVAVGVAQIKFQPGDNQPVTYGDMYEQVSMDTNEKILQRLLPQSYKRGRLFYWNPNARRWFQIPHILEADIPPADSKSSHSPALITSEEGPLGKDFWPDATLTTSRKRARVDEDGADNVRKYTRTFHSSQRERTA